MLTGHAENSKKTASDELEEGGDDVKSVRPLRLGLHTCYNGRYNGLPNREAELIPENRPQFRSKVATRLREAGIVSNPVSATTG